MFALGFLFIVAVFLFVLILSSKLLPSGLARFIYVVAVLGALVAYPYAYKLTPAFSDFNELCERADRYQVPRSKPVSFILIEWGYATDCTKGPGFVDGYSYAGFDCQFRSNDDKGLYRYTKMPTWHSGCGLECFERSPLEKPESTYSSEDRYGYVQGKNAILTGGYGIARGASSRDDQKLVFHDRLLVDEGVMAYGRDYTYYPYGNGWAKILGLASGSAPAFSCKTRFVPMDLRDAYKPRAAG
jgi:hypothetical protein